jgi:protein-disulfide isomerase
MDLHHDPKRKIKRPDRRFLETTHYQKEIPPMRIGTVLAAIVTMFYAQPSLSQLPDQHLQEAKELRAAEPVTEPQRNENQRLGTVNERLGAEPRETRTPGEIARVPTEKHVSQASGGRDEGIVVSVDDDFTIGSDEAEVTMIEFSDYQCPACARYTRMVLPRILNEYVKTGKVKYVIRDFPIERFHKKALQAALAAECSEEQGRFLEMHQTLFENQGAFEIPDLLDHASILGLDVSEFKQCMDNGRLVEEIHKDVADAQEIVIRGTPSFFIGLTEKGSSTITARRLTGVGPYRMYQRELDRLLDKEP